MSGIFSLLASKPAAIFSLHKHHKWRSGASQIDWIVSLTLFLFVVGIAYVQVSQSSFIGDPSVATKEQSISAKQVIEDETQWELAKEQVIITAPATQLRPTELSLSFDTLLDNNSVVVLSSDGTKVASDYFPDESLLVFDERIQQRSIFFFLFSKESNLTNVDYNTTLQTLENPTDYLLDNGKVEVTCDQTGLANADYLGEVLVTDVNVNSVNAKPSFISGDVRAKCIYSDTNITFYANSTQIHLRKPSAEEVILTLPLTKFDKYYNGTVVDIPSSPSTIDSGVRTWIDFYNTSGNGVSLFAKNANVVVTKDVSTITVTVNNQKDIELFFHNGTYINAQNESSNVNTPPSVFIHNPVLLEGMDTSQLQEYQNLSYDALQAQLAINYDFNITVSSVNISLGKTLPIDEPVFIYRYPTTILDRFGNQSQTTMTIGVW